MLSLENIKTYLTDEYRDGKTFVESVKNWGSKQNNRLDKKTNFIYDDDSLQDFVKKTEKLTNEELSYAENRKLHWLSSQIVESTIGYGHDFIHPIKKLKNGKEDTSQYYGLRPGDKKFYDFSPKSPGDLIDHFPYDIFIDIGDKKIKYFDIKGSVIGSGPGFNGIRDKVIKESENHYITPETKKELIELNYKNQSTENRYSNGPRLFIFFLSKQDVSKSNELKLDFDVLMNFNAWFGEKILTIDWSLDEYKHSLVDLNKELERIHGVKNDFNFVNAAAFFIIKNEDGSIEFM